MAETLLSPGVLARENDQSFISAQPVQAGAALVGPTVKGPVEIPQLVTSYSQFKNIFGATFESGSQTFSYLTSVSAFNYFQNGGESLLVTRVTSGSFTAAESTTVQSNIDAGNLLTGLNTLSSSISGGFDIPVSQSSPLKTTADELLGSIATGYDIPVTISSPLLRTSNALSSSIGAGFNITASTGNGPGTVTNIQLTGSASGTRGLASITFATSESISNITVTAQGAGYTPGETITIPSSSAGSDLAGGTDITITLNDADLLYGSGPGLVENVPLTGSINGIDGVARILYANSESISSITVTTAGQRYTSGETITIPSASAGATLAGGSDIVITLNSGDLSEADNGPGTVSSIPLTGSINGIDGLATINFDTSESIASIRVTAAGKDYAAEEIITIPSASAGANRAGGKDITIVLDKADLLQRDVFDLETLSEGVIMNNTGGDESAGALQSGSVDNIRWEITNVNVESGVFSLLIRRGDDNNREKTVLETWQNLSLDPKAENYIEKVIGNSTQTVLQDGSDYYIQTQGSYTNKSNYIRVKAVHYTTPDYFDSNGEVNAQYTASMPQAQSGSFQGATGDLFSPAAGNPAKFNENVTTGNIQGLTGADYDIALKLLGNRDDYRYNVITAPGLTKQNAATQITSLSDLAISRGDNIAVIDLVNYGSNVNTVTDQAKTYNTSYAAAYWPWAQTIDPDSGQTVWVPASTLIPGVYSFTDRSAAPWFAPAGINRGGLDTVIRVERKLPTSTRDTLYTANVNPIATLPQAGVVVFGQKTLQKKASALDRINVRRLLIALKNYISQIGDTLVFEQNTTATRNSFLNQVNPYLESVRQRQGLYAFKVVMDESNNGPDVVDRNELIGQIFLQPTKTAEYVILDFNVLPTGASFPV